MIKSLKSCSLKVTPQRIAVMDGVINLKNDPTAENLINYIKTNYPNIAKRTVFKTLYTLVKNNLIKRVKTDSDIMIYDAVIEGHHHLYCIESERLEDFYDSDLDIILDNYLKKKDIPHFKIEYVILQITGKLTDNQINFKTKI